MSKTVVEPVCPECHKVSPFAIPAEDFKHCTCCGAVLPEETKEQYSWPKCPEGIEHGHCAGCKSTQAKSCDSCGSRSEVMFRPQWGHKCLCHECRMTRGMAEARSRSW